MEKDLIQIKEEHKKAKKISFWLGFTVGLLAGFAFGCLLILLMLKASGKL